MIDCPECWHQFAHGNKCPACGHIVPGAVMPTMRLADGESEAQRKSNEWLVREGVITEDMTSEERKQAIHEYRGSLVKKPRKCDISPKAWARSVLERESPDYYSERLAIEALANGGGDEDL